MTASICVGQAIKATAAVCLVGLALSAPSAEAHEVCAFHGDDKACNHGTGYPSPHQGHYVDACDGESDGNRVRAHWNLDYVTGTIIGGWDPDGAGGLCRHDYNHPNFGALWRHRICEEVVGCSGWLQH